MTMETVYAIHSFEAENDDEIPFQVGEPILVLEKDDLYGDSWWKGKNVHGQIGLFPMTYISFERPPMTSPVDVPSLSTSNDSTRENLQPSTPNSALNMHGSDLDLPLPPFRMPSPSIDETIDDIKDKLQRMAVRTEEEQVYQERLNKHRPWTSKNGHSSKVFAASSSGSSTTSSRMSSMGKQHGSPRSQYDSIGSTKKVDPLILANGNQSNGINKHPETWDVDQVCMWLSEKGFNSELHHFFDNDITGDVLIGLNISTLLKELNINSFGKRVHIMNAINELKSQFSLGNENDDVSDLEEFHNTQTTSYYPENHILSSQNSLYNQAMDSSLNLSLSHINDFRASTTNLARNFPPTYYTHSQRVDDAEGANIETIYPRSTNKKERIFAKLSFSRKNNPTRKKDRTNSTGGWDFNKGDRSSFLPKRSIEKNDYSFDHVEDITEETLKSIVREPDYTGWLRKQADKYKTWKSRYCVLKGPNLYYFKNDKDIELSNVKGYINLTGYRVIPDENILHGKYGFKLIHDTERSHYFAHDDVEKMKSWMKAMIKSTIARDNKAPVISSSNIATVPLSEARKLTPRPPDPRRPSVSSAAINVASSPILRATSPSSQRAGSPIPTRPSRPLSPALQSIHNQSSPIMRPFNNNRSTMGFF